MANISSATDRGVTLTDYGCHPCQQRLSHLAGHRHGQRKPDQDVGGQLTLAYGAANTWLGGTIPPVRQHWAREHVNTSFGASGSPLRVTGNATIFHFQQQQHLCRAETPTCRQHLSGKTLTIVPGQRCVLAGSLAGEGNLKLAFPYVRGDFAMTPRTLPVCSIPPPDRCASASRSTASGNLYPSGWRLYGWCQKPVGHGAELYAHAGRIVVDSGRRLVRHRSVERGFARH